MSGEVNQLHIITDNNLRQPQQIEDEVEEEVTYRLLKVA